MDNKEFADELRGFLERTKPAGLPDADIRFQTSLAVIVITSRADANLKVGGYTVADLASQGLHGGVGPHKELAQALKGFGIVSP
jgi:hypothetical protein